MKGAAPLLAGLGLVAIAAVASAVAEGAGLADEAALEERGPIEIESDADFTPENGVRRGSGSPDDPFVIENWTIRGSAEYAVEIEHARAAWVLRNVRVDRDHGADVTDGVWLVDVVGGCVEHVVVDGANRYGIYVGDSTGVMIERVAVTAVGFVGVYAHNSSHMEWSQSVASRVLRHGFYLANGSSFNRITDNLATDNRHPGFGLNTSNYGVYTGFHSNDNVIANNSLSGNSAGVQVNFAKRIVIRDNVATANRDAGILVLASTDVRVDSNVVVDNPQGGITLTKSERTRVVRNTVQGAGEVGLELGGLGSNVVHANVIAGNALGVRLLEGDRGNLIYDNYLANDANVLDLAGGSAWNASKSAGPNVAGGPFVGGNWWSDLPDGIADADGDGLAETGGPFTVGGLDGEDRLPIARDAGLPRAAFDASDLAPPSRRTVKFTDASTTIGAPIANWTWDFGDGARAFGPVVHHAFREGGDYRVVLRVRDATGLSGATSRVIAVQNALPVPRVAGAPEIVTNAARVTFDARASTDSDGEIRRYAWDFGDGALGLGPTVTHEYVRDGAYAATLLVEDNRLGTADLPLLVVLDRAPPSTLAAAEGPAGHRGWIVGAARLSLAAADDSSGVARSEWRSGGPWLAYDGPVPLADGVHAIDYRSVDRAGNAEAARRVTVRVDATPPTTRLDAPRLAGPATRLPIHADDATSGVARTFYRLPSHEAWRVYEAPFGVAGEAEGVVVVRFLSEDAAGNVEAERVAAVELDLTPPAVVIDTPTPRSITVAGETSAIGDVPQVTPDLPELAIVIAEARVVADAVDAHGLGRVRVLADGRLLAEAEGFVPDARWIVPPGPPARHVLRVEAWDAVGNVAVAERDVLGLGAPA